MSIWSILDIERTRDRRAIRAAYARRLRDTHPEDDPAAFQALRRAYDLAIAYTQHGLDFQSLPEGEAGGRAEDDDAPVDDIVALDVAVRLSVEITGQDPGLAPHAHAAARARLAKLLTAGRPANPEALLTAFDDLTSGDALDDVGLYTFTETWLAERIIENAPRADALIPLAIERFGWDRAARSVGADRAEVPRVMARGAALQRLAEVQSPRHIKHEIFRQLARGPDWTFAWRNVLDPTRPADVEALLDHLAEGGLLEADGKAPVAAWRAYFAQPHLTPAAILIGLMAAMLSAVSISVALAADYDVNPMFALAISVAIGAGVPALKTWVIDALRLRWRQAWWWRAPAWARVGWAPAGLALMGAAAVAVGSALVAALVGAGGLATMLWAHVTNAAAIGETTPQRWLRFILSNLFIVLWWIFSLGALSPEMRLQVSLAAGCALAASTLGENSALAFWRDRMSPPAQIAALGVLLIAGGAVAAMLSSVGDDPAARTRVGVAIVSLVLTCRLPGAALADWLGAELVNVGFRLGWIALIVGSMMAGAMSLDLAPVAYFGGGWLFIVLAVGGCLAALVPLLRPRR